MIVGNGLIANAFKRHINDLQECLIFASGVSNSQSCNNKEYEREVEMIRSCIQHNKVFVYFSTCSIFDHSLQQTDYIIHKKNMENLIEKLFSKYLIVRLPIVIGNSNNPNTLFNYLSNRILKNEIIELYSEATRYIIDIEDVSYWILNLLKQKVHNIKINVGYPQKVSIIEIIAAFEELYNKKANINLRKFGNSYNVDFSVFLDFVAQQNKTFFDFTQSYLKKTTIKYYRDGEQ